MTLATQGRGACPGLRVSASAEISFRMVILAVAEGTTGDVLVCGRFISFHLVSLTSASECEHLLTPLSRSAPPLWSRGGEFIWIPGFSLAYCSQFIVQATAACHANSHYRGETVIMAAVLLFKKKSEEWRKHLPQQPLFIIIYVASASIV